MEDVISIQEEIDEQDQELVTGGGQGWGTLLTTLSCYGISWVLGNDGNFCTATAECQANCSG